MDKILYIAEGEIEQRFFDFLKRNDFIQPGRFKQFNLMQNELSDSHDILKSNMGKIYCVLDTDCADEINFHTLEHNVKMLRRICPKNVFLLIQHKNFENELSYVLECKNLCRRFNLKYNTEKDLKRYLAQSVIYSGVISKENLTRYCRRPEEFKAKLQSRNCHLVEKKVVLFQSSCMKK